MSDIAIRVEGLGKRYSIGRRVRHQMLRDTLTDIARGPLRWLNGTGASSQEDEHIWALRNVSFDVRQGEVVGVIGGNGAGKSTLLKIISRITRPSEGQVKLRGRVGSLLEVGTGFHPELTGRENIYLNGAILGMKKAEIDRKFDEIVAFSEVDKFLDTPVKRYSSGMYVRLAFAVAAHLEPEILIVDEVLAVGDLQFQKKCLGKMGKVAKEGRTVIFVSHNMPAISTLCSTAMVLDRGTIICQGPTNQCIAVYSAQGSHRQGLYWARPAASPVERLGITQLTALVSGKQPHLVLELDIELESRARHRPAFLAVDIADSTGTAFMQALPQLEGFLKDTKRQHLAKVVVDLPPLIPGQYLITVWVGSHNTETLDEVREVIAFEVYESPTLGRSFPHTSDHGYIVPPSTLSYR